MPIVIRYDAAAPLAQAAINAGQFATDQTLAAQSLRERAFAEDNARAQAQFALGGVGQAFQQRQQLNDQAFRQQQAQTQNNFQQQSLDQNNAYRQDALAAQLQRAQIGADAGIERAAVAGDYRLQGIGMQQAGADQRNQEDNDLKLLLQQNGLDWRTADRQTVEAARQHLQQMRGQQQQDLAAQQYGYRGALQDDQQTFQQGLQDQRLDQQQGQFDARQAQQRELATSPNANLAYTRENRIAQSQQLQAIRGEAEWLLRQYPSGKDPFTGAPLPRPPQIESRLQALNQQYQSLAAQLQQAAAAAPDVSAPQVYQQQPASNPAMSQEMMHGGQVGRVQAASAAQQIISQVKSAMPGASREQIKAAVIQQLQAQGIDPATLQ